MTAYKEVSLEQMLKAREDRVERQRELIGLYGMPLISFTINMPGRYKSTPVSRTVFREGCHELMKKLAENGTPPVYSETHDNITGYEAYFAVNLDELQLKELVLQLEYGHPIGRLFDFDVIGCDGNAVSRETLGRPRRKCLICGKDAYLCARSRAHNVEELLERIDYIVDSYIKQKPGRMIFCNQKRKLAKP